MSEPKQVPLKGPDGDFYTVAPEDVADELAAGASHAKPEEWQAQGEENRKQQAYGDHPFKAALEGAVAGALPAVGPYVEHNIVGESQESMHETKHRNPAAYQVGELGGVAAGTFAGDELGEAAAKGLGFGDKIGLTGEAIEGGGSASSAAAAAAKQAAQEELTSPAITSAATPLAKRLGKAAAVNAGYGAGQAVNEYEIGDGDPNHLGQSVLAGATIAALLGAGTDGLLSLGERALPPVLSAASDATDALGEKAGNLFDKFHAWKTGQPLEKITELREAATNEGEEAFNAEALAKEKAAAKDATYAQKLEAKQSLTQSAKGTADAINEHLGAGDDLLHDVNSGARPEQVQSMTMDHPLEKSMGGAQDMIEKSKAQIDALQGQALHSGAAPLNKASDLLDELDESLRGAQTTADVHDAVNKYKQDLGTVIFDKDVTAGPAKKTLDELKTSIWPGAKNLLEDPEAFGKLAPKTAAWNAAQAGYLQAKDDLMSAVGGKVKLRGTTGKEVQAGKIEQMLKGGSALHPLGVPGSKADAMQGAIDRYLAASKRMQEEAGNVYKDSSKTAPDPDELKELLDKVTGQREAAAAQVATPLEKVAPSGPATTMNAVKGGKLGETLEGTRESAGLGVGLGAAHLLGFPVGTALGAHAAYQAATNTARQIETLARIASVVKKVHATIKAGAAAFVKSGASGVARGTIEHEISMHALSGGQKESLRGREDFDKRSAELDNLTTNPAMLEGTLNRNTPRFHEAAPDTALAMNTAAVRGAQYLQSIKPKNPSPPSMLPSSEKWTPSESEVATYAPIHNVVVKPLTIMDHLRAGTLTPDIVTAVRTVVPELHAQMCDAIQQQILDHPKSASRMDFGARLQLTMFLGHPIDLSTGPDFAVAMLGPPAAPAPQGTPKPVRQSQAGLKNLTFGSRAATASQERQQDSKTS